MSKNSERYLTRSVFAAKQGWSPSYVTKLGQQGRLVFCPDNPKLIDAQETLAYMGCTDDPKKKYLRQYHAAARVKRHVTDLLQYDSHSEEEIPSAADHPKYWDVKTRREITLGDLARLELAKKQGFLVERQKVEEIAFASGRMLRDAILGLPTQLSPEIAMMKDTLEIEVRLKGALQRIFDDMDKIMISDLGKALEG